MVGASLYCPRLIERDDELGALLRVTASLATGTPAIVFVSGEAGIGKTRLLEEYRTWAARRAAVAAATCFSFAPAALRPIRDLAESFSAEPASHDYRDDAGQLQTYQRFFDVMREAAKERGAVAIVDDAHWADPATLEFLKFAAHGLAGERIAFVIAYRTDDAGSSLDVEHALARIARSPYAHHIRLRPLSKSAVAEMIDATLGTRDRPDSHVLRSVNLRSEGNPLFAEELLKSALDEAAEAPTATLRGLVASRTATMSAQQRHLLEMAALIGRRFDAAFLESISETPRAAVLAFLRAAVQQHFLIEERTAAGWFAFRHALVRDAILATPLLVESRERHLAIGSALEREPDAGDRVAEISEHFWQAGATERCLPYARLAGDRAMAAFSYLEAVEHYERALRCTPGGRSDAAFHERLAEAYHQLGNDRALRHGEIAVELAEAAGDRTQVIRALILRSTLTYQLLGLPRAMALLDRADLLSAEEPDEQLHLRLFVHRAQLAAIGGDLAMTASALERAEPMLPRAVAKDAIRFHNARGIWRFRAHQDYAGALEDGAASVRHARASGNPTSILTALSNYGVLARRSLPPSAAAAPFEEALSFAVAYTRSHSEDVARSNFALTLVESGRLDEAGKHIAMLLTDFAWVPSAPLNAAIAATQIANYLRDDTLFERTDAANMFERVSQKPMGVWCELAAALAQHAALAGDADGAQRIVGTFVLDPKFVTEESTASRCAPAVGAAGSREHVDALLAGISRWRRSGNDRILGNVALFDAYVALRFGAGAAAARERATAAIEAFARMELPLLEAEANVLAGNRTRAAELMKACGARRLPGRSDAASVLAERRKPLSPREREVVELAVRGASNRAIAEQLFLSERTVESHLRVAFAKFGVNSRGALAAAFDPAGE